MDAMGIFEAMAYVDPQMGQMAEFAETVAVNRGMPTPPCAAASVRRAGDASHVRGPYPKTDLQPPDSLSSALTSTSVGNRCSSMARISMRFDLPGAMGK